MPAETHANLIFQFAEYYKKVPQRLHQQLGKQASENIRGLVECDNATFAVSGDGLYKLRIFSRNSTVIFQKLKSVTPETDILCIGNSLYLRSEQYLTNYRSNRQALIPKQFQHALFYGGAEISVHALRH